MDNEELEVKPYVSIKADRGRNDGKGKYAFEIKAGHQPDAVTALAVIDEARKGMIERLNTWETQEGLA
jgi:hypothetical protein